MLITCALLLWRSLQKSWSQVQSLVSRGLPHPQKSGTEYPDLLFKELFFVCFLRCTILDIWCTAFLSTHRFASALSVCKHGSSSALVWATWDGITQWALTSSLTEQMFYFMEFHCFRIEIRLTYSTSQQLPPKVSQQGDTFQPFAWTWRKQFVLTRCGPRKVHFPHLFQVGIYF